jgi:cell division protein FtsL
VRTAIHEKPVKRVSNTTRKNREKASHMSLGYVAFLAAALCLTMGVLYGYITLQAGNTAMTEEIAALESELNSLKLDNDEEYSRIMSMVDMEHVKEVAMGELGMQYAEEGQIIEVEGAGDDYVRQYQDMP